MQLSEQTQAILLLTAWFGKHDDAGPKPLTPTEWGRFALFLMDTERKPADLLHVSDVDAVLAGFEDSKVTSLRVHRLLERSAALGIALEKWQRAGLWVITRSDADYPRRWKQRLKNDAPPFLFGSGNRGLLNRGGIAVVGSRDLDESQVRFTGKLGRNIGYQGQTVISGGARGADEAAMLGALESDGMAVGVLADSLLRTSTSAKYRKALMSNDLALVSSFNPEAGFNAGNAMARNKYIYCLSDAAIVIAATENKGGTWSGAIENLKRAWVPLWVRQDNVPGNNALVAKGAHWLPDDFEFQHLVGNGHSPDAESALPRMAEGNRGSVARLPTEDSAEREAIRDSVAAPPVTDAAQTPSAASASEMAEETEVQETPYQLFLHRVCGLLGGRPLTSKELQSETMLKQKQLFEWLKRAEMDGVVVKTRSPVKYRLCRAENLDEPGSSEKSVESDNDPAKQTGFGF